MPVFLKAALSSYPIKNIFKIAIFKWRNVLLICGLTENMTISKIENIFCTIYNCNNAQNFHKLQYGCKL